ncbi:hypothetical protein FisN_2Lh557 [Fistulifera solaris]|uniref:Amine oxidase domain-containing protein n=1 Tax=Fistulifera solaris TaxID=1519565 RepID=A0A1Z5JB34_FISSO|nr:hypothetical protein FisN_2Lh557 [Fistulifera solaris]|eukprot:GAX11028.1 hypothetical protein FisN_2Lh557 [Fistulifera solaris]
MGSCRFLCLIAACVPLAELWVHPHMFSSLRSIRLDTHDSVALFASNNERNIKKTHIVIVGGGWAGLSVADSLSHDENVEITLLDAGPAVGGLAGGGALSPRLQLSVEPGLHGFWREYRNTIATLERIGVMPGALTEFTPSILVSQHGRVALAPVLANETLNNKLTAGSPIPRVEEALSKLLPPPLDVALLSEFSSKRLSTADRISALGLVSAWADFEPENRESWLRYDNISAEALFRSAGVTPALYDELVAPLLHVLPMTTGYDCSAAAALSCFHVFALQSKGAFDVRWCTGSIGQTIFQPWIEQMTARRNVKILSGQRVTNITAQSIGSFEVSVQGDNEHYSCDAVVMAVGGTALKRLALNCPLLQVSESRYWNESLRGVTCVAVRLFFDRNSPKPWLRPMKDSPVVVCGPNILPELVETGFCIYDLNRLQPDVFSNVTALEVDFFRADGIANMESDDDVADLALKAVATALRLPSIAQDRNLWLEVHVIRARNAVSHFCLNSAKTSPGVRVCKGVYFCGDWIDRTGHSSWSTEKAVVTGRQAALSIAKDFNLQRCDTGIIPAPPEAPPLMALRKLARLRKNATPTPIPFF